MDPSVVLPTELMVKVLGALDTESLIRAGQVSKRWRLLAKHRSLWFRVDIGAKWYQLDKDIRDKYYEFVSFVILNPSGHDFKKDNPGNMFDGMAEMRSLLKNDPETRKFFRALLAAPVLGSITLDFLDPACRFWDVFKQSPCKEVRALELSRHYVAIDHHMDVFSRWGPELHELRVDALTADLVAAVDALPRLEVLHFESCKRRSGPALAGAPGPEAVFAARPADRGTLVELGVHASAPLRTVVSLLQAHRATLRRLRLPLVLGAKKLEALARCSGLEVLHVQAQPALPAAVSALPRLRHLILDEPTRASSFALPAGALPDGLEALTLVITYKERSFFPEAYVDSVMAACRGRAALRSVYLLVNRDSLFHGFTTFNIAAKYASGELLPGVDVQARLHCTGSMGFRLLDGSYRGEAADKDTFQPMRVVYVNGPNGREILTRS